MDTTPNSPAVAPVSTKRAIRLRRFLADLRSASNAAEGGAQDAASLLDPIDRALWDDERVLELVRILFDCDTDDEAGLVAPHQIEEALIPYLISFASLAGAVASTDL